MGRATKVVGFSVPPAVAEAVAARAATLGIAAEDLMIIHPERCKNDADGPCHPSGLRTKFWTDLLPSLELSYVLLLMATVLSSRSRVVFAPAFDYNGRAWSMQEPMSLEEDRHHGRCAEVA